MQLNSHTVLRHMDKHTATYSERETHMRFTFADGGALQTVLTCLVSALCASLCAAAPVSQLGVFAQPSVSVHNGHTTTLPCWLSPSQNAEGLEVRWYREGHYDSPVMLYRGKKFESASQSASYVGRVSFGPKDAASTGLVAGDVSLMLINATLEDAADYICYVTSERGYDSGSVKLTVTGKKAKEEVDAEENVTLDQKENEYLKIIENRKLRDDGDKIFPDGQNVTCLTAIKGTPGFTSGQHYWEVSLVNKATGLKQSWWLGATSASVIPQDKDFIPTPSNGYWFLSSRADHFQFNTEPNVVLPVYSRPEIVGVYLNYDSGELSFYDVQKQSLIGSLTTTFTGEVFPLFNPGKNDKTPMEIIHKPVQGQSDNAENEDPTISAGKNDTAPPEEVHMTGQGQSSDTENRNSTAQ
ncbi:E3 ubiquitin-protein ligase TRIM39 [Collichthys lucidus]|uniref:E3 ubiquitin-protein ligase TRIM39 n=1 Tax=Collichthys lucidus TaxID=240159 RepID=A0A4U5VVC3_COLLU|nr:E3 ubiquitin-protein ligase TRIM39 [Collichthys lucidus]